MGSGAGAAQVSDDTLSEGDGGRWRRRRRVIQVAELGLNRKVLAVAGEFGVVLRFKANQRGLASAGVIGGQQMERQRRWRRCGTMLDGESQAVGPAGEVEVGIAPAQKSPLPRSAWPGRAAPLLRAWWTRRTAALKVRASSRSEARMAATWRASFSSARWRRTNGSRINSLGAGWRA